MFPSTLRVNVIYILKAKYPEVPIEYKRTTQKRPIAFDSTFVARRLNPEIPETLQSEAVECAIASSNELDNRRYWVVDTP